MRPFDEIKATQAAAQFLKLSGGRMHYMLLLKLMYIMDRQALLRWGSPVTNDRYYSLPKGPILSRVYNLMVDEPLPCERGFWSEHISEPSYFQIELTSETGTSELSEAEEKLISEVFDKFGKIDRFKLVGLLHEELPEWKDPNGGRIPISIADILKAGKKTPAEIKAIQQDLAEADRIEELFGQRPTKAL